MAASCLRALLSGNGLRQSGVGFFFFVYPGLTSGAIICRPSGAGVCVGHGFVDAHEGDAGECAAEICSVALAVLGVVQDGVDVVEDVPLGNRGIVVVGAELFEGRVGDVLAAVGAVTSAAKAACILPRLVARLKSCPSRLGLPRSSMLGAA